MSNFMGMLGNPLLHVGLGMMQAAGPSRMPKSFGQIMGEGMSSGLQSAQQYQMRQGSIDAMREGQQRRREQREAMKRISAGLSSNPNLSPQSIMALAGSGATPGMLNTIMQQSGQRGILDYQRDIEEEERQQRLAAMGGILPEGMAQVATYDPQFVSGILGRMQEAEQFEQSHGLAEQQLGLQQQQLAQQQAAAQREQQMQDQAALYAGELGIDPRIMNMPGVAGKVMEAAQMTQLAGLDPTSPEGKAFQRDLMMKSGININLGTPGEAGALQALESGLSGVDAARNVLFDEKGKLKKGVVNQLYLPAFAQSQDARMVEATLGESLGARVLAQSGQAMTDAEYRRLKRVFFPQIGDGEEVVRVKLKRLEDFLGGAYDKFVNQGTGNYTAHLEEIAKKHRPIEGGARKKPETKTVPLKSQGGVLDFANLPE